MKKTPDTLPPDVSNPNGVRCRYKCRGSDADELGTVYLVDNHSKIAEDGMPLYVVPDDPANPSLYLYRNGTFAHYFIELL